MDYIVMKLFLIRRQASRMSLGLAVLPNYLNRSSGVLVRKFYILPA